MDKMKAFETDLATVFGRVNALHTALLTIARSLPPEAAATAGQALAIAAERVHADALATPSPDALVNEMERSLLEFVSVLQHAAQTPSPRPVN